MIRAFWKGDSDSDKSRLRHILVASALARYGCDEAMAEVRSRLPVEMDRLRIEERFTGLSTSRYTDMDHAPTTHEFYTFTITDSDSRDAKRTIIARMESAMFWFPGSGGAMPPSRKLYRVHDLTFE